MSVTVSLTDNMIILKACHYFFSDLTVLRHVFKNETKHINFWTDCIVLVASDIAGVCGPPIAWCSFLAVQMCPVREALCLTQMATGLSSLCTLGLWC